MRVLLDTHAFLWFILDDPKLSTLARGIIEEEKMIFLLARQAIGKSQSR